MGLLALSGGDDNGSAFWVIPERQLVIVNIVNERGQRARRNWRPGCCAPSRRN